MRTAHLLVTATLAGAVLTGCTTPGAATPPTPAITVTRTATPAPSTSQAPVAAPFTAPGTELGSDETLMVPVVARDDSGGTLEVAVELGIVDATVGTIEDMADVLTPAEVDELWYQYPVFVHYRATVSGPPVPTGFTISEPVSVTGVTSTGGQAAPTTADESPALCPPLDVAALAQEGQADGCWTLVARYDSELTSVEYRGGFVGTAADYTSQPVRWDLPESSTP